MWRWLLVLAVPFIFLCLSTVYIYAHYAIDAIAGLAFGIILFFLLGGLKLHGGKD
jgi:membrane-associated phospholipid phosphatase